MSEQVPEPLLKIIQDQVIPLWRQGGMERCLIAPHDSKNPRQLERWLESDARISSCPYKGQRVAVKGPRPHKSRSTLFARWPHDKLQARRIAMLAIVLNGETDFRIGERMLHCHAGNSILLLPGTPGPDGSEPHLADENRKHGQCDILWISGGASTFGCWVCHSEGKRHFELPGESCYVLAPGARNLFNEFVREASDQQHDYLTICHLLMQALLIALCREIKANHLFQFNYQKVPTSPEFAQSHLQEPISAAQNYMKNNLHEPLQIDEVARRFLLSRTEFTQGFKRETGKTFKQYLTELRMEEARHLLKTTSWSITKISETVSFQSSRLRFLFNRYYGLSPQEFRRQSHQSKSSKKGLQNDQSSTAPREKPQ